MTKNYSFIIADHIRAASFVIADGVEPSGKHRGYILRRLIRRSFSASLALGIDISDRRYFVDLVDAVVGIYDEVYDEIKENKERIVDVLVLESQKYLRAISVGEKEWSRVLSKDAELTNQFLAEKAWDLYQTHGVPFEVSEDIAEKNNLLIDEEKLNQLIEEHQQKSQTTSAGQFKSGLGDDTKTTRALHTATHLFHGVMKRIFGEEVHQIGSAITDEKARFDFNFDRKLEDEELEIVRAEVQKIIDLALPVVREEMSQEEAEGRGATGLFGEKYGDIVSIYTIKDGDTVYSCEFCGGPHVENTSEIGKFEFIKQKSVGAGKKRVEFKVE